MLIYLYGIFIAFMILGPLLKALINIYPEFLWFIDLGYQSVFLKIWEVRLGVLLIFAVVAFFFIYANIFLAMWTRRKLDKEPEVVYDGSLNFNFDSLPFNKTMELLTSYKWIALVVAGIFCLLFGGFWFLNWDKVLLFYNGGLFGKTDPIFNQDIGFYFFIYPFYKLLQTWLSGLTLVTAIMVGLIYFNHKAIRIKGRALEIRKEVKVHISVLLAIFFGLLAWSYKLNMYHLLYSAKGLVYGAGYSDIHADLLGYKVLFVVALFIVGLIFVNIFRKGILLPLEGLAVLVIVFVALKVVYPSVLQQFVVKPNEIEKERPYIEQNVAYTREAYNLNNVEERTFTINNNLKVADLQKNQETISNIRLWDHRPLLKTLDQLQAIRLYYDFNDVDIDRYTLNGKYQQVMLSARELDADQLPEGARNWINQRLTYTHGHGLVMLPVNKMTSEGLPNFYIYDIPAKINADIKIDNPDIYFGESTNKYIIVNTKAKEFDYPQGDNNKYTVYKSHHGILLNNFFKKVLFAIKFQELNIILSDTITPKSRVLFDRNIKVRLQKIAPFLFYDSDPYMVLSKGKLYWITDAYTMSDMYPYAQPFYGNYNYIRNAVKVVVDAYTGETSFYLTDKKDPLILAYSKIFPSLFKDVSKLDPDLVSHFRYPEDLFTIQAKMYSKYHMNDPQVFYNQEDLWVIPNETFEDKTQPIQPYYTMMKLPEDDKLTFRLMMPFTPSKKNNMIGWMSANSDAPNYGKITVYKLPKEQMIYGPQQIESRIDQDTEISKQLSLWGQKGSQVIRGNLLVIPLENSFIYVEPVYLQATQSRFPELKRIVVAYGNKIAMEETFELALQKVFDLNAADPFTVETKKSSVLDTPQEKSSKLSGLIDQAGRYYSDAQKSIQNSDWKGYGENIKMLGQVLEQMRKDK